jgi:hypothetical protein
MNKAPRLPFVPAAVAAIMAKPAAPPPAPAPEPAVLSQTNAYEAGEFTLTPAIGAYPVATGFSVYTTKQRWAGADVYVSIQGGVAIVGGVYVRTWVYGITGSSRTLVDTGWLYSDGTGKVARRVASARAIAERFEVVAEVNFLGATMPTVNFAVVASDECLAVGPGDNAISLTGGVVVGSPVSIPAVVSSNLASYATRLTGAVVTNTTAGALFWQAVDAASVAAAAGLAPVVSITVPANATVLVPESILDGYRFGVRGCICGGSTTAATFTTAGAGAILQQVWGS